MKSFKAGKPLGNWLLRISLCLLIIGTYFNAFSTLNLKSLVFFTALIMLLLGTLLFLGGLFSKPTLTVIAGLFISIFSLYKLFISFNWEFNGILISHFALFALGFHFFSAGNEN